MAYRKTPFVEEKRQRTRDAIVDAARLLVTSGGWGNCTLTRVANDAGISTGSIYTHFRQINDLYIEVFLDIAEAEVAVIRQIARGAESPRERLEQAVRAFTGRALKGRTKAYAVMSEPVAAEVDAVRQKFHARFVEQFETIIADGIRSGDFPLQDARLSATCIVGALIESLVSPPKTNATPTKTTLGVVSFCLRAVGAEPSIALSSKEAIA